jgi:TonB-dependent starch-binding outer membrane protein SusC
VRFGYSIPPRIARKCFMQDLNAYVYANNLLTWTNYTGFDPEVNQTSVLKPGKDAGRYPRRREIGLGVNITF